MSPKHYKTTLWIIIGVLMLLPLWMVIKSFEAGIGNGLLALALLAAIVIGFIIYAKPSKK
ncbi:hypothetical protein [Lacticaseibacillus zhaodongensis]|uniref:hypothetical protein n=1 Tax=Lacticaseibacillus zhaodongensis TaxID=2668065 RepID=UPI0012D3467D|nr:hypothetical protein [Lacticaseibacillus zhaodongensis]